MRNNSALSQSCRIPNRACGFQFLYGIGGEGKSALLTRYGELCTERKIPWARVDLGETPDPASAITVLAAQLAEQRITLSRTKRTLLVLTAKKQGEVVASPDAIAHGSAIIRLSLDALGLLPPLSIFAAAMRLGHTALAGGLRHAMKNAKYRNALLKLGGEDELIALASWTIEELTVELVIAFSRDLAAAGAANTRPGPFVVLFLDRHEALWRDAAGGAGSRDVWIRQLYRETSGTNTLIVMAGRDALDQGGWWRTVLRDCA